MSLHAVSYSIAKQYNYTPEWTSASTQPVLNNGSIGGTYHLIGNVCHCRGLLSMGSTTTFGTGAYFLTLPFPGLFLGAGSVLNGIITLFDSSASTLPSQYTGRLEGTNDNRFTIVYPATWPNGTFTNVTNTAPFTWAQSDTIQWSFTYAAQAV